MFVLVGTDGNGTMTFNFDGEQGGDGASASSAPSGRDQFGGQGSTLFSQPLQQQQQQQQQRWPGVRVRLAPILPFHTPTCD